jgi:hydroxypyruvate isomerase
MQVRSIAASALDCKQANCLAGLTPANVPPEKLREEFVANLKFAAPKFNAAGIKLLIEPINSLRDMPEFYLNHTQQAIDIIRDTGSDNLFPSITQFFAFTLLGAECGVVVQTERMLLGWR